MSKYTKLIR
uniref:Uncharacterized protein n=1 Tax=Rhizophora mucronata TaxID=61149 RepID=A0A2P2NF74_RHIMU